MENLDTSDNLTHFRAFACPNRVKSYKNEKNRQVTFNKEVITKRRKSDLDWHRYIQRGELVSDSIVSYTCGNFAEE